MTNFFFPPRQLRLCVHTCRLDNTCKGFTNFYALSSDYVPSSLEVYAANKAVGSFF